MKPCKIIRLSNHLNLDMIHYLIDQLPIRWSMIVMNDDYPKRNKKHSNTKINIFCILREEGTLRKILKIMRSTGRDYFWVGFGGTLIHFSFRHICNWGTLSALHRFKICHRGKLTRFATPIRNVQILYSNNKFTPPNNKILYWTMKSFSRAPR